MNLYFLNNNIDVRGSLKSRVSNICNASDINFIENVFNESDLNRIFHVFPKSGEDGLVDSLRRLLYPAVSDRELIKLLLRYIDCLI